MAAPPTPDPPAVTSTVSPGRRPARAKSMWYAVRYTDPAAAAVRASRPSGSAKMLRAGATTSRFYGASEDLLGHYAWYVKNSNDRAWPVGQLKPRKALINAAQRAKIGPGRRPFERVGHH